MSSNPEAAVIKDCPTPNELRALLDGTMPEGIATALQRHVDQCRTCQKALETLTVGGESWVGVVHELKQPAGSGSEHHLQEAMSRMKSDDSGPGERASPDAPTRLDFLSPSDQPGSLGKLGNYEISEVVGQGGMGVVLKAFDASLHRVVAVKILASHLAHHATARKRFIREAQAAAAVCHENVVTIHAIDEIGPQPKIVMQFVSGGSLQERLDQEGPFDLKEILRIGMQTAAGLAAAHAQGLVHRDVKPANILLENGVQRVKLTDFGLARVVDDASLTLSGVIAGTPQYMAPEQAWGKVVDHRADLFGLGAVMYAMCVGHSPFRARSTMAVLKRVCEEEPRPIAAINPDIPDWLSRIIGKLLAKNPDERFKDASEVCDLLAQCLSHVQQPLHVPLPPTCATLAPTVTAIAAAPVPAPVSAHAAAAVQPASEKPAAASVPPRTSLPLAYRLQFKWGIAPMLLMLLVLIGCASVFTWPPGPPQDFFAFSAMVLAVNALTWTVFYLAWSTDNGWPRGICIGLLMLGAGIMLSLIIQESAMPFIVRITYALSAVLMVVYVGSLLLYRPWVMGSWQRWLGLPPPAEIAPSPAPGRLSRFLKLAVIALVLTPVVFVALLAGSFWAYQAREREVEMQHTIAELRNVEAAHQRRNIEDHVQATLPGVSESPFTPFPSPQPGTAEPDPVASTPMAFLPGMTSAPQQVSPAVKDLVGRWVVLTAQGPEPPVSASEVYGSAGMTAPGAGMMPPGMGGGGSPMAPGTPTGSRARGSTTAPDWIEITDRQLKLVSSKETAFDFGLRDGRVLSLRDGQSGIASDVRTGIYLRDGDRLVICWGAGDYPVTQELKATGNYQLLVCRREWQRPEEDPFAAPAVGEGLNNVVPPAGAGGLFNPAPRAVPRADMPFTPREAQDYQQAWADKLKVKPEIANSIGIRLRIIPPGNIRDRAKAEAAPMPGMMGGMPGVANASGSVSRSGVLGPIYVGVHEVTRGQFRKFVEATNYVTLSERIPRSDGKPSPTWREPQIDQDSDNHPVVHIWGSDAIAFTQWLSRTEKKPYRLLSTDEWEFAMRAGSASDITLGTNKLKHRSQFFTTTAPVGSYTQNPFGLHDLIGNAAEWTWGTQLTDAPGYGMGSPGAGEPVPAARLPQVRTPVMKLLGGDFATRIEASLPGQADVQEPSIAGFRVAIDLTESSLLTHRDDLEQLSDGHDMFVMQAVWCDVVGKPSDVATKKDLQLVVAVHDLVPRDQIPYAVEWTDFEIQRGLAQEGFARLTNWKPIDVAATLKWLEQVETETDSLPAHLKHATLTMPVPRTTGSKLVGLDGYMIQRDLVPAKSEAGHPCVFRFFDTTLESNDKDAAYIYRYRLKYRIPGLDSQTVHTTPWKTSNGVVTVDAPLQ